MPSKGYTLFFIASVGLVLISIVLITVLSRDTSQGSQDLRAKATVQNSLKLTGKIISIDGASVVVDNVKFENAEESAPSMGTFTVTLPAEVSSSSLVVGKNVLLGVDAATFNTSARTVTALSAVSR